MMKQSEKYDLLHYILWYFVYDVTSQHISNLRTNKKYILGPYDVTGKEIQNMWNELVELELRAAEQEEKNEGVRP